MAQAIFKHWFVDFEFPDENGKPYKSSGGEMVNNQLGMIPPKWSVNENSDVFKLLYGKALKAKNRHKGDYPVVGSNGIIGTHSDFLVKGPGIVIGRKGNPGTVNYVWNNFYPIDTTFYVQSRISLYFLYFALKRQNLNKQSTDSAVPGLSRKIAYMNLILIPDLSCIKKFDEIIDPIFRAIYQNERENVKLKVVRDTLLPKLMSGEIRVPTEQ
ncbi:restriction endonuclease subunit S, partial [Sporolactobacillus vineae]|uniref:restriction endonuclease subunit S n=1 Tax=Sporolactobacillus vineae TaxID=444463 RepID=UPI0011477357